MKVRAIAFTFGMIMVSWFSTAYAHYECIGGQEIELRPPSDDGASCNQDAILYSTKATTIPLSHHADLEHQMFVYSVETGARIYGDDWCYDPQNNMVRLTRKPPRLRQNDGPGHAIKEGALIGVDYVPIIP